ncbi:MAG: 50S ribosomal protein L1 [bacterium]
MKEGKKYRKSCELMDKTACYALADAVELLQKMEKPRFDPMVEVAVNLGVDQRQADQNVRGAVTLPHGTGKQVRVLVFAKGEKESEATEAGADFVGCEDLIKKIEGGWFGFDRVAATPDVMGQVGKIGRLLGPRGLMPNPKVGTITFDVGRVVKEIKSGMIEFRVDKGGIIHAPVGKGSFESEKLTENITALLETLQKLKPANSKGHYFKAVTISSTYSPGIKLDISELRKLVSK